MGKSHSTMLVTVCAQRGLVLLEQSNTPLMHCSVNDSLLEVTPLFDKSLLQMVKLNLSNPESGHGSCFYVFCI